ncbi:hypothetical protein AABB24_036458, partial [Solanum stoloniferum]
GGKTFQKETLKVSPLLDGTKTAASISLRAPAKPDPPPSFPFSFLQPHPKANNSKTATQNPFPARPNLKSTKQPLFLPQNHQRKPSKPPQHNIENPDHQIPTRYVIFGEHRSKADSRRR